MILRLRQCQDVVKTRYIQKESDFRLGSFVTCRSNLSPRGNGRTGKFLRQRSPLQAAGLKLRIQPEKTIPTVIAKANETLAVLG
jgi:hypothetical protein